VFLHETQKTISSNYCLAWGLSINLGNRHTRSTYIARHIYFSNSKRNAANI
jgi:hypothetical protein